QYAFGASWKIRALIMSLFLEIHKVFLQKNAFIRTQIFSGFALAELCGVALRKNVRSASLRTSDRCHWCGNPHLFHTVSMLNLHKEETDFHASVATLARNDGSRRNSYLSCDTIRMSS
ncbi:MAG: hypothetical protein IJQ26_00855, partial [Lachnospiraceae bacterium]|nr:hypothetical protein [Lachnospiraceae bacterium]